MSLSGSTYMEGQTDLVKRLTYVITTLNIRNVYFVLEIMNPLTRLAA